MAASISSREPFYRRGDGRETKASFAQNDSAESVFSVAAIGSDMALFLPERVSGGLNGA